MRPTLVPSGVGTADAPSRSRLVAAMSLTCGAIIAVLASVRELADADTGWHLALGRAIAAHGFTFKNALSWTAPDFPAYPTSWLYDWLAASLHAVTGPAGVQALTLALLLLTLAALAITIRSNGVLVLPAAVLLLLPRVVARPHVATWVTIAWVLVLCRRKDGADWRSRLAAVAIIAWGGNMHSGAAFAAGILGIYCVEAAWRTRAWIREGAIALAGGAALLANPGGLANARYLLQHLHVDEVIVINEFRPPTLREQPVFFLVVGLIALFAWRLRRQPAALITSLVFAVLSLTRGRRFIFEFFLVSTPLLAAIGESLLARGRGWRGAYVAALTCAALNFCTEDFVNARFAPRFDLRGLPVRAVEFVRNEGLDGKLFNSFHDGGYIEWMLPSLPAFMDSRIQHYPEEFFKAELRAETSPAAFQRRLRSMGVEWAITASYGRSLSGDRLLDSPDWALVYWDEVNEIFLRRDVPRFAEVIARNEFKYFRRSGNPDTIIFKTIQEATPEVLRAYEAELDRFQKYTPRAYMASVARCALVTKAERPSVEAVCAEVERNVDQ